jgi:hypothetical protein
MRPDHAVNDVAMRSPKRRLKPYAFNPICTLVGRNATVMERALPKIKDQSSKIKVHFA